MKLEFSILPTRRAATTVTMWPDRAADRLKASGWLHAEP